MIAQLLRVFTALRGVGIERTVHNAIIIQRQVDGVERKLLHDFSQHCRWICRVHILLSLSCCHRAGTFILRAEIQAEAIFQLPVILAFFQRHHVCIRIVSLFTGHGQLKLFVPERRKLGAQLLAKFTITSVQNHFDRLSDHFYGTALLVMAYIGYKRRHVEIDA